MALHRLRATSASPTLLNAKKNPLLHPLPGSSTLAPHLEPRCSPARGSRARGKKAVTDRRLGLRRGCSLPAGPLLLNTASVLPLGSKNTAFVSLAQRWLVTGALVCSSRLPSAGRNTAQLRPAAPAAGFLLIHFCFQPTAGERRGGASG